VSEYEKAMSDCVGRTVRAVEGMHRGSEETRVYFEDGSRLTLWHKQDCCESVKIEDVCGEPDILVGHVLSLCEAVSSEGEPAPNRDWLDSYTWTFYKLAGPGGSVTLRWLGESNGYYSESVAVRLDERGD